MIGIRQAAIAAIAFLSAGAPVRAGSIWARANGGAPCSIYADDKAADVGDIVTVVIKEHSKIEHDSSRDLSKSDSRSAKVTNGKKLDILRGIDAVTGKLFNLPELDITTEADTTFAGETAFDSDRKVEDEITVVVEDVLPNGNLVVLGKRLREVQGDTEIIQISGLVRPSDISFDNTVDSTRVGNFHMVYSHTGRENRFTKPGWLARILNFINPF
jgi:flagellar L-ring protein precursor FlgH